MLCEKTRVLVKRQKLVGLSVGGRPAADDCPLERIRLKAPHRFILMGTPEVGSTLQYLYIKNMSRLMRAGFFFTTSRAAGPPSLLVEAVFCALSAACDVLYGRAARPGRRDLGGGGVHANRQIFAPRQPA